MEATAMILTRGRKLKAQGAGQAMEMPAAYQE